MLALDVDRTSVAEAQQVLGNGKIMKLLDVLKMLGTYLPIAVIPTAQISHK